MPLKWIMQLYKAFTANRRPGEMGAALAFAVWLALVPAGNLTWYAVLLFSLFFRQNLAVQFVFLGIFALFFGIFDPWLQDLGLGAATWPGVTEALQALIAIPGGAWFGLQQSVVAGGLLAGAVLWIPLFFAFTALVSLYQKFLWPHLANNPLFKALGQLPLIKQLAELGRQASGGLF